MLGRTSDGTVTIPLSIRYRRAASTDRRTDGIKSSAVGWSSDSDSITWAGVLLGSIRRAVSTKSR